MRAEAKQHSFYKSGKLQLLLHADSSCTQTLRELEVPLAITHTAGTGLSNVTCLAVDGLSTALSTEGRLRLAYSPYGYAGDSPEQSVAVTGQRWDPISECYLLGAGRVPYSPVLMRRTVSDPFSPFGKGGINSYMYCNADPINYTDPSGRLRLPSWLRWLGSRVKRPKKISREALVSINAKQEREIEALRAQLAAAINDRHETSVKEARAYGKRLGVEESSKKAKEEAKKAYDKGVSDGQVIASGAIGVLARPLLEMAYDMGGQAGRSNRAAFAQMRGSPEAGGTLQIVAGGTLQQPHTNHIADPVPIQGDIRTSPEPGRRAPDV
ncbi:RHS repeat-associated core domain-containing protein [Pseudomonas putida]|uniref:RHS repeat-associated core domain-containing protein n=1 Tax=Pseudomonas putida TaxID=303 RepID=A0AAP9MYM2_PSEPU|nr:RHS repeat-associated core domain-containing protein [Pseudomonas putida]